MNTTELPPELQAIVDAAPEPNEYSIDHDNRILIACCCERCGARLAKLERAFPSYRVSHTFCKEQARKSVEELVS